jgi:hypothetical protein
MAISVDISSYTASADGKIYEAFPTGNSPSRTGTASLNYRGTVSKGNTITVETDGTYHFGTKAQSAPILWVFGSDTYENGVNVTFETGLSEGDAVPSGNDATSLWQTKGGTVKISKSNLRGSHVDQQYEVEGGAGGYLGWPYINNGSGRRGLVGTGKLYVSGYEYYTVPLGRYRGVAYNTPSGTLDDGSTSFDLGETFTVSTSGKTGTVIYVDTTNTDIHMYLDSAVDASDLNGYTLTGDTSGATVVLDTTTYTTPSSSKILRIWENAEGSADNLRTLYVHNGEHGQKGVDDLGVVQENVDAADGIAGITNVAWSYYDAYVDWNGAYIESEFRREAGGALDVSTSAEEVTTTYKGSTTGPTLANIGFEASSEATDIFSVCRFGEIYMDNTPQRIVIGDAATWATCTEFNHLRPTDWTDSTIEAVYQNGTGGYLYVVDRANNPLTTTGVSI